MGLEVTNTEMILIFEGEHGEKIITIMPPPKVCSG